MALRGTKKTGPNRSKNVDRGGGVRVLDVFEEDFCRRFTTSKGEEIVIVERRSHFKFSLLSLHYLQSTTTILRYVYVMVELNETARRKKTKMEEDF